MDGECCFFTSVCFSGLDCKNADEVNDSIKFKLAHI